MGGSRTIASRTFSQAPLFLQPPLVLWPPHVFLSFACSEHRSCERRLRNAGLADGVHFDALHRRERAGVTAAPAALRAADVRWLEGLARTGADEAAFGWLIRAAGSVSAVGRLWEELQETGVRPGR